METEIFRNVVPFVAVVEAGSFRGAAARLGVSAAAVSKAVQALEADVGAALLHRDARAVTLTREGELFFDRARQAVAAVKGARQAVDASRKVPEGELTVSAPFVVTSLLGPALGLLRARFPRLCARVTVTDRLSRLAEESIDVAVRVGPLRGAGLVSRKLRRTRLVTVASPAYLARRGTPRRVDDLAQHDCLVWITAQGRDRGWLFASGAREPDAAARIDHAPSLVDGALAGVGVTQLLDFMADPYLRDGRLVQVLEAETSPGPDVSAVCAPGHRAAPRTRAAFEAFADAFSAGAPTTR